MPFRKSKNEDAVSFVKKKVEEATDWTMMRQVHVNRAFYRGHQWISWDRLKKSVYIPELRPGEKRYTYNIIKPMILTLLAKLTKNKVKLEVHPDSNEDDRIQVAKAAYKFLHYQWESDSMDYKSRRLKMHMLVDGQPALKVYVDKTQGQDLPAEVEVEEYMISSEENPLPKEEGYGAPIGKARVTSMEFPQKTGKIVTEIVDQLSIKVDPAAEDISRIRWALEEKPMDVELIKELWSKEIAPDGDIGMRMNFDLFTGPEANRKFENMAMVTDYWELPCPKYPKGRRIVVAGGELLELSDNPGEFPFIFFPAIPIPGKAIADAVVTDLTTPQKSYNIKRTAEARVLEEMGNPMWIVPRGTVDDEQDISNEIGGIVFTNFMNGVEPRRVQGATVDGGWQNAMNRDIRDMEDISGAHDISRGIVNSSNATFGGLQLQVEQDETKLALLVHSYEEGIKKWGEKVLRLVQKYFPEEQMVKITGETAEVDVFAFTGADLSGGEMVDVVPNSSMPTIKAAEDQKVIQMWQMGMFIDPRTGRPDHRKVMRLLGQQVAVSYFADAEQDENMAMLENKQWMMLFKEEAIRKVLMQYVRELEYAQQMQIMQGAQGEMAGVGLGAIGPVVQEPPVKLPKVRDFYDHEVHIERHNRFRKTEDYEELPAELQRLVDMHVDEHKRMLGEMMKSPEQEMMMQAEQAKIEKENALKEQKVIADMNYKAEQLAVQREAQAQNKELNIARLEENREKRGLDMEKFIAKLEADRQKNMV